MTGIREFERGPSGDGDEQTGGVDRTSEQVIFNGRSMDVPIVDRGDLSGRLVGPAIVMEPSTTTVVPPGWELRVGSQGHLIMERGA
ncbi:MAG: hypothetical protein F4Y40_06175 [Acidimicrobiia bacterium]|nr:hypothetical protein [Acidimicrobiia bacterium]